ncbi:MAG: 3-deoxy-D-manno-octulosonic acid transferase [Pyrinomonadaceae bacterium]|nr:3-deoxy-D-manno-octulosonic acid transferase [Pyrinomonadaceae bacterium]
MFLLYSFLYTISFVIMSPLFLFRRKKYASGFKQRLGNIPELKQDERAVVWIHCVSVGETNAARSLVDEIIEKYPHFRIVISTTTRTGHDLANKLFSDQADRIFYFPFDWRFAVRKSLRRINPKVILVFETEIWLNFFREAYKGGARVLIVNGRLSEKSVKRYSWIQNTMKRVLNYIDLALMQDHKSAKRMIQLGIRSSKVKVTGNMKFDQVVGESESDLSTYLKERFGISEVAPLVVAASTHSPEEKIILDAFKEVWKKSSEQLPRLLIAPRHPERFDEVEALIRKTGFDWVRRTEEESGRDKVAEVILLDSIGELRDVYPMAEIVFMGGSLIPHGGQSFLEPAINVKPIFTGFYTMNFDEIARKFVEHEALIQLPELKDEELAAELIRTLEDLLKNKNKRDQLGKRAFNLMIENSGATEKTIEFLHPFLKSKAEKIKTIK